MDRRAGEGLGVPFCEEVLSLDEAAVEAAVLGSSAVSALPLLEEAAEPTASRLRDFALVAADTSK